MGRDEEGELWIGGVGVAKGYLHAPGITQDVSLS
jgi:acyl-CoA synthetase (AMP-forming)/AMP-acid ligase II